MAFDALGLGRSRFVVGQAELIAFGIRHATPAISVFVKVIGIASFRSQGHDLPTCVVHIRHPYVEMNAILDGLQFGNTLKAHPWEARGDRGEVNELWRLTKPCLDLDPKDCSPKGCQTPRVIRVGLDPSQFPNPVFPWHCATIA